MNTNEKKFVEKTLKHYEEKKFTKLDELKRLDRKSRLGATIFAYIFGTIGALVLGLGMCLAMNIIANHIILMILGIVIGLVGIFMVSINYLFYRLFIKIGRKKYASQIKQISEELLSK